MRYETLQLYSQLIAGFLFLSVLVGVAIYTFWPSNRARFAKASQIPLDNGFPSERR